MESALTKDNTEVSIDDQSCATSKTSTNTNTNTLPSKEHTQKLGLKLEEVVQKLEEIIEFYGL